MEHLSVDLTPLVRAEVVKALDDHIKNRNGTYYLGTRNLTFPINYTIPLYSVMPFRFDYDIEESKIVERTGNLHYWHVRTWGYEHDPDRYLLFPKRLELDTLHPAEHQYRTNPYNGVKYVSEYLNPLRPAMSNDHKDALGRIMEKEIIDMKDICGFCLGHKYPEDCRTFYTVLERHQRMSNINWTLFLEKTYQLCLGCMQREHGHVGSKDCLSLMRCCYCNLKGHHKSLCTSILHHKSLAIMMNKEDVSIAKKQADFSDVTSVDDYMMIMYDKEMEYFHKVDNDLKQRVRRIEEEVKSVHEGNFLERLLEEEHKEFEEKTQAALVLSNNVEVPEQQVPVVSIKVEAAEIPVSNNEQDDHMNRKGLDPHFGPGFGVELEFAAGIINSQLFDVTLDRNEYARDMRVLLERVVHLTCCNGCKTYNTAIVFCTCGKLHLCYQCIIGQREGEREVIPSKFRTCDDCGTTIPAPPTRDEEKDRAFVELVMLIQDHICALLKGFGEWSRSGVESPDLMGFLREVKDTFTNIYRQFECNVCHRDMNVSTRTIMKYSCKCGTIICRTCLIKEQMTYHVEQYPNAKITCSKDLVSSEVICRSCWGKVTYFGTCSGLSVLSNITSHFLKAGRFEDEISLQQLYDHKVYMRDTEKERMSNDYKMSASAKPEKALHTGVPLKVRGARETILKFKHTLKEEVEKERRFHMEPKKLVEQDPEALLKACEQVLGHYNGDKDDNLVERCNAQEQNEENVEPLVQNDLDRQEEEKKEANGTAFENDNEDGEGNVERHS